MMGFAVVIAWLMGIGVGIQLGLWITEKDETKS